MASHESREFENKFADYNGSTKLTKDDKEVSFLVKMY